MSVRAPHPLQLSNDFSTALSGGFFHRRTPEVSRRRTPDYGSCFHLKTALQLKATFSAEFRCALFPFVFVDYCLRTI